MTAVVRSPLRWGAQTLLILSFSLSPSLAAETTRDEHTSPELTSGDLLELIPEDAPLYRGPGSLYKTRGRVYRDEPLRLIRSRGRDWVEIERVGGGAHGWLRHDLVRLRDASHSGSTSPNIERERSPYRYDQRGRRVDEHGYQGSGEGTREGTTRHPLQPALRSPRPFELVSMLGVGRVFRSFQSDIAVESSLESLAGGSLMFHSAIELRWRPLRWLRVFTQFSDWRGGSVAVSAPTGLEEYPDFSLALQAQRWRVGAWAGYSLARWLWGGLSISYDGLRSDFQQVSSYNLFLSQIHHTAQIGIALSADWPESGYLLRFEAGALFPWDTAQSPLTSGLRQAGNGWAMRLEGGPSLTEQLRLLLRFEFATVQRTFSGPSTQSESLRDPPIGYDEAESEDQLWALTLALSWGF